MDAPHCIKSIKSSPRPPCPELWHLFFSSMACRPPLRDFFLCLLVALAVLLILSCSSPPNLPTSTDFVVSTLGRALFELTCLGDLACSNCTDFRSHLKHVNMSFFSEDFGKVDCDFFTMVRRDALVTVLDHPGSMALPQAPHASRRKISQSFFAC